MTRKKLDAYYTPDALAQALIAVLPMYSGERAWEPHAGGGAFVRALLARGVGVTASDIDPDAPALREPYLAYYFAEDFLQTNPTTHDWVVGNPPFTDFERHVDHALKAAPCVAFLLRLAAMESEIRVPCWQRWPLRKVWVLAQRPSFTGGGTDYAAYGWFWFDSNFSGMPEIVPGWSWR